MYTLACQIFARNLSRIAKMFKLLPYILTQKQWGRSWGERDLVSCGNVASEIVRSSRRLRLYHIPSKDVSIWDHGCSLVSIDYFGLCVYLQRTTLFVALVSLQQSETALSTRRNVQGKCSHSCKNLHPPRLGPQLSWSSC